MNKIRVLMTKIGMDGHDRGVKVVIKGLRDAGMEVIYTGPWQAVEDVAQVAMQEDVNIVGISSLAGDEYLIPGLMKLLREKGLENIVVIVGGIIPDEAEQNLRKAGVSSVFHPGTSINAIVDYIEETIKM